MTNLEIICNEALNHKIFTEEEINLYLSTDGCLPLHTFSKWKKLGYSVKRGEHAKVTTLLWKVTTKKEMIELEDGTEQVDEQNRMRKVKSYLFTLEQVQKL